MTFGSPATRSHSGFNSSSMNSTPGRLSTARPAPGQADARLSFLAAARPVSRLMAGSSLDAVVTAAMVAGCVAGAIAGAALATRTPQRQLGRGFALLAVA